MGYCAFCETKPRETWLGSYCSECRQLKNLCNVYGYERVLGILKEVCIRNEDQLERKILAKKIKNDDKDIAELKQHETSEDKEMVVNPKIIDEKSEFYLRRQSDRLSEKK